MQVGVHMSYTQQELHCKECSFVFRDEVLLHKHVKSKHVKQTGNKEELVEIPEINSAKGAKNTTDSPFKEKVKTVETPQNIQNTIDDTVKEEAFICGQCNCSFNSFLECQEHIEAHLFKCYKCDFESVIKGEVMKHEKKEHSMLNCDKTLHTGKCNKFEVKKE